MPSTPESEETRVTDAEVDAAEARFKQTFSGQCVFGTRNANIPSPTDFRDDLRAALEAAAALRQPQTVSDEEIDAAARVHHDEYERLAAERGYDTRKESRLPWDQLTPAMQRLMRDCERASIEAFLALRQPREGRSPMDDDEKGPMPSLTLIFTTDDEENADWDRLLDLSDVAYRAIEFEDPRFHILKAFTFYAGTGTESQHELREKLATTEAALASTRRDLEAHMDAAKVREAALAESRGEAKRFRDALQSLVDRHPASPPGEHPAVDIARAALEAPHEST